MPPNFTILRTDWANHRDSLLEVRTEVFVKEQGVPAEIEEDEFDPVSIHFLGRMGEEPVATARLLPDGKTGRVAVAKKWRGKRLGRFIMEAVIETAKERGDAGNSLHAQTSTVGFYESLGYESEGEEFEEAGIGHYRMWLSL